MRLVYIADLQPGDLVDEVFAVRDSTRKPTRTDGRLFAQVTLADKTGDIQATRWDISDDNWKHIKDATFMRVRGHVKLYQGKLQIDADMMSPADTPADLADFTRECPGDRAAHWRAFCAHVHSIRDEHLVALLKGVFIQQGFIEAFKNATAAEKMHHAYAGGLLEHTVQVASLCDAVAGSAPELRRDLLMVGALLHDVGKVDEIASNGATFGPTMAGGLVGHVAMGASMVDRIIGTLPGFPPSLRACVLHLILSHQGTREWGAPVTPAIPEALVLHACDNISAKLDEFATAKANSGGLFAYSQAFQGRVFLGDVEMADSTAAPGQPTVWLDNGSDTRPVLRVLAGGWETMDGLPEFAALPILGRIAAGTPIEAQEHVEGHRVFPLNARAAAGDFLLRVSGDSMRDAHILDGDLVRVHPADTARDGDIVAAVVNGDVTVKRLRRTSQGIVLHPENADMDDIRIPPEADFQIQGVVVALLRETI